MLEFGLALCLWLFGICLLDFIVKARYVEVFERRMDLYNLTIRVSGQGDYISWDKDAIPFFKDTGPIWKWRNCLLVLCLCILSTALIYRQWWFIIHFTTMFPVEFLGYWLWVGALKHWVPQHQYFLDDNWAIFTQTIAVESDFQGFRNRVAVRRTPHFGEVPAKPLWLPSWYRRLYLHSRPVIIAIVFVNFLVAVYKWRL